MEPTSKEQQNHQ